ncbi:hypothetical protein I79_003184 [Cricetulus griseus]|uniref:Uncharacterized protein n=1 Tax=Cricetulus griseus TaxID=10029 RepID=G3GZC3_CRIGR|nr:hypothetical protein I79_003184 [Cricetulus griseus]
MSLEASFEFQKPTAFPVSTHCIWVMSQVVSCQLLLQYHTCLPAAVPPPAMTVMESNPLKL